MADQPVVKLGFFGGGYMGQLAHIQNYWKLPGVELVALAEGRAQTAAAVAKTYGIAQVYPHHEALLADADVDAIVAIGPFALNAHWVEDALQAGKHVITEKPQCNTSAKGRELIALAAAKGVIYQVGYMKRCDPGVRWAKAKIAAWKQSGAFGALQSLRIWCSHGAWNWFREPAINLADEPPRYDAKLEPRPDWITDAGWQHLTAWTNYYSHQTNLSRYLAGEDYTLDGAKRVGRSQFLQNTLADSGAQLYMDFASFAHNQWDEGFEVVFEKAKLTAAVPAPMAQRQHAKVTAYENDGNGEGRYETPTLRGINGFEAQAEHFVASVRGQEPPLSPAAEAVKEIEYAESLVRYYQEQGLLT